MKKLSVKDLVEFRRRSAKGKKNFAQNIKLNKIVVPKDGGGDYWITSLSAVCNCYKTNELGLIDEKIAELETKLNNTRRTQSKNMYQRNVAILQKYLTMDIRRLRPNDNLSFLKKSTANPLLNIRGLQLEAKPSHVYTFGKKGEEKVGAIWFTAKVNGYGIEEVTMFCEMLFKFLKNNYSKKFQISPKYCVAVDMLSGQIVDYTAIENGQLAQFLTLTIEEIKRLM